MASAKARGRNVRKPDFNNILKVLNKQKPDRFTLFEYYMNNEVYDYFTQGTPFHASDDPVEQGRYVIEAFKNAGYDYAQMIAGKYQFNYGHFDTYKTRSLNAGAMIEDEESFEAYEWTDPNKVDFSPLEKLEKYLPDGMKLIVSNNESVFGGAVRLMGYDNLCYMLMDDRELVRQVWNEVGSRVLRYNEQLVQYDSVGAVIVNDDWGFNTQTLISPNDLREFVFPWHKKIVETIHKAGKPAILHSCGNLGAVYEDIINDMGYDGKHSYQDNICPVETMYDQYGDRLAIMGGIDVDYMCRMPEEEITKRSRSMLERAADKGGFALGSGNSIADFVPLKNYLAMLKAIE